MEIQWKSPFRKALREYPPSLWFVVKIFILVLNSIICCLPALEGFKLSDNYVNDFMFSFNMKNGILFVVIFSLGTTLPILVNTVILLKKFVVQTFFFKLLLILLVFIPESILLHDEGFVQNIVAIDCVLRIRFLCVMWIIAELFEHRQDKLMGIKLHRFAVFCGGSSLIMNTFAAYDMGHSEAYFIAYLVCSILGVFALIFIVFRMRNSISNKKLSELSSSDSTSFLYVIGALLVSSVFIIVSLILHYSNGESSSWWCVSFAIMVRNITAVVVFLVQDHIVLVTDSMKAVHEESATTQKLFVRLISHELRSPFNAIEMSLDVVLAELCTRECSRESIEALEQIRSSCDFSVSILNDLLSAELLEKGIMQLEKTSLDTFSLILDVFTPCMLKAQEAGVSLKLSPSRHIMASKLKGSKLHADKGKLLQLFKNLLIFSTTVTASGGVVSVEVSQVVRPVGRSRKWRSAGQDTAFLKIVIFCPTDSIPVDKVSRIFSGDDDDGERFGTHEGNLWVCKSVVDLHNGEISVSSAGREDGCTFTVLLPLMSCGNKLSSATVRGDVNTQALRMTRSWEEKGDAQDEQEQERGAGRRVVKPRSSESMSRRSALSFLSAVSMRTTSVGPLAAVAAAAVGTTRGAPVVDEDRVAGTSLQRPRNAALVLPGATTTTHRDVSARVIELCNISEDSSEHRPHEHPLDAESGRGESSSSSSERLDDVVPFSWPEEEEGGAGFSLSNNAGGFVGPSSSSEVRDTRRMSSNGTGTGKRPDYESCDSPRDRGEDGAVFADVEGADAVMAAVGREVQVSSASAQSREEVDTRSDLESKPETPSAPTIRYGSTVLVVDDSELNLKMMRRLAAQRCDEVLEAVDGVEAVAAVQRSIISRRPIDVVLMDFQMPNMDGPTAASKMREMGYKGPIIGVTGNVLPADMELFISKGANKVLFKPINANQVDFAVRGWQLRNMDQSQGQR